MKTQTHWKGLVTVFGVDLLMSSGSFAQTVSLDLEGMSPHLGQKLEARLISKESNKEVDRAKVDAITTTAFSVLLKGKIGESYWIDFYADLNENGVYDAPPIDHAWRINANSLLAGTNRVRWPHNTLFTDIMWTHVKTYVNIYFKSMFAAWSLCRISDKIEKC